MVSPGADRVDLLTPSRVAFLFGVDTATVHQWADTGQLTAIQDTFGDCKFPLSAVYRLLGQTQDKQGLL